MKTVFQTNHDGFYVGTTEADECQLEPGVFHIPAGCVEVAPPVCQAGERARWNGAAWEVVVAALQTDVSVSHEPTADEIKASRMVAIKAILEQLDKDKIRPLTDALLHGDTTRLAAIEAQQQVLRDELKSLAA